MIVWDLPLHRSGPHVFVSVWLASRSHEAARLSVCMRTMEASDLLDEFVAYRGRLPAKSKIRSRSCLVLLLTRPGQPAMRHNTKCARSMR